VRQLAQLCDSFFEVAPRQAGIHLRTLGWAQISQLHQVAVQVLGRLAIADLRQLISAIDAGE
jgi:hypothetical protein